MHILFNIGIRTSETVAQISIFTAAFFFPLLSLSVFLRHNNVKCGTAND